MSRPRRSAPLTNIGLAAAVLLTGAAASTPTCGSSSPPGGAPPTTSPSIEIFTAADGTRFSVDTVVTQVEVPWSLAFAPDGRLFFTERPGRVRIIKDGVLLPQPALTMADVVASGESGALGLALHPEFARTHFVYVAYTARASRGAAVNRLVRYREVENTLVDAVILLDDVAAASIHDGSRVKFGPDGKLYMTMGDAANADSAQDLASYNGKILRLNDDGTTPRDNPFSTPVFSFGHRNSQGIDWHLATGDLWATEHGNIGNDEINVIDAGKNYGWPVIEGAATRPDMVAPLMVFTPAVAPSGGSFYRGSAFPTFQNNFFFATLAGFHIHRLRLDPDSRRRVIADEKLVDNKYGRIRDVMPGPDGFLYFSTSNRDGRNTPTADDDRILRLVPAR